MKDYQKKMISLIRASLTDYVPEEDSFDFDKLFRMAGDGGYTSLIYYGALKVPSFARFSGKRDVIRQVCTEIARSKNQMEEVKKFSAHMDQAGVDYCLLKGTELKPLYPHPEMRPMHDADILVRESDCKQVFDYLKNNGYFYSHESSQESVWLKTGMEIEIHTRLMAYEWRKTASCFESPWENVVDHYLSPDYSFLFQIVHLARHSGQGSMPLRHLADCFVYTRAHPELDLSGVEEQLEKMNLLDFFRKIRRLMSVWFEGAESDSVTDLFANLAFQSREDRDERALYASEIRKENMSRPGYVLSRIFRSYGQMCDNYPILIRYPVLLPACWVCRAVSFLSDDAKKKESKNRTETVFEKEKLDAFEKEMETVGLKDWY